MARVLVVEDEPNIAGIITFKLLREGHEVRCESDPVRAAEAAAVFQPDVVVVDTAVEDGFAGQPYTLIGLLSDRCPVLALTEPRNEGAAAQAVRRGAAKAVEKPFKPTVLAHIVAELVEAR